MINNVDYHIKESNKISLATSELGHSGTPSLPSPPFLFLLLPSSLSPGVPPPKPAKGLGSAVSSPVGSGGEGPADKRFGAYLSHKKLK